MIIKLKIGEIPVLFIYQFEDFFGNSLHQYITEELPDNHHVLEVHVKDKIKDIIGGDKFVFKNKVRIRKNQLTYIVAYNPEGKIKHMISYTNDYKHIIITLNKNIGKKLAESEYVLSGMMFFEIAINNRYLPIHASAIAR